MDILAIIQNEIERDSNLASPHTRRAYQAELERFEAWRAGRPLTRRLVEGYVADLLSAGKSPATANRALAALRWWATRLLEHKIEAAMGIWPYPGQMPDRGRWEAQDIRRLENIKQTRPEPRGRRVTAKEVQALIAACKADSSPIGARDLAMIGLAWTTGVTQSELTALQRDWIVYVPATSEEPPEDWHSPDDVPAEPWDLWLVEIDGPRSDFLRKPPLSGVLVDVLMRWFQVRGDGPGYLFCPIRKGGRPDPTRSLGHSAMQKIISLRVMQAGISQPLTWNDFRYSMILDMLEDGTDPAAVQQLVGHKRLSSTLRYAQHARLRRGEAHSAVIRWMGKSEAAFYDLEADSGEDSL